MNDIETDLQRFRFPSTTTRAPRSIMKYYRLKANESRVLLLITYPIFKKYLKPIYYKHLQLLSFALQFLRHKKAYTFFILGRIASTVNGTKNLPREIENNLQLIKNSSILLDMYCISSPLYLFISDLQDCKSNSPIVSNNYQVQKPTSTIHDNDKQELLLKFDSHDNIKQESPEKEAIFNDEEKVEKQQELSINLDALKQEHKINLCNEPEEALPNSELKQEEAIKDEQDQSSLKRNFV
ncbi:unnamed protein product [Rotaria sp. Silwood2]|nr:unnamed protein product [Rotaria sp. Silwood2]CAF4376136.1 unnamed protein product [Rotaria sp. Silwood2]